MVVLARARKPPYAKTSRLKRLCARKIASSQLEYARKRRTIWRPVRTTWHGMAMMLATKRRNSMRITAQANAPEAGLAHHVDRRLQVKADRPLFAIANYFDDASPVCRLSLN